MPLTNKEFNQLTISINCLKKDICGRSYIDTENLLKIIKAYHLKESTVDPEKQKKLNDIFNEHCKHLEF